MRNKYKAIDVLEDHIYIPKMQRECFRKNMRQVENQMQNHLKQISPPSLSTPDCILFNPCLVTKDIQAFNQYPSMHNMNIKHLLCL
uniref:Uncharacterized protein n=1 Tax=Rhizophora mucronata TaxID=61149 RepID=A0A2P2PRI3_RHIMU